MGMFATSIGSLPFVDVDQAVDAVFRFCPQIPFWPQLPRRSFYERMYAQCLENTPALVLDEGTQTMYMDTRRTEGIESFYDDVHNGNVAPFFISDRAAPGLYRLLERLPEVLGEAAFVKVQLAGPFTIGVGLKDENGKSIIYDGAYFDIVKKTLHMKAEWLISTVRSRYPDLGVILFFDEPALVSFGSAFVQVSRGDATSFFNEVVSGLDATVGVHCCGNTDWPVLLDSSIDVINYDAFNFMDTLFYFRDNLRAFLDRGGRVAPGIVPSTGEALEGVEMRDVAERWFEFRGLFSEIGQGVERPIVTTACGLGSLKEEDAYKALGLLKGLCDTAGDE